jgi:hypothetical protein
MSDSTGAHPDFVQFYNPGDTVENIIIYNNQCINMEAQGLFGQNCRDFAVVNLLMEKDPPESYAISQMGQVWDHVLLWHVTTRDAGMALINDSLTNKSNFNVQDNLFQSFGCNGFTSLVGSTIAYNHFTTRFWNQPTPMGTNYTQGNPLFADTSDINDDYRISTSSPCYQSGVPLPGVPADMNGNLWHPTTPDRGCFSTYQVGIRNTGMAAVPAKVRLQVSANPLRLSAGGSVVIRLEQVQPQPAACAQIVDVAGTVVATLAGTPERTWNWAGKSDRGLMVTAGIYFVRVTTRAGVLTQKIVVMD